MIRQINPALAPQPRSVARPSGPGGAPAFGKVFEDAIRRESDVKISSHAAQRLSERSITLGQAEMQRIGRAAEKVAAKGGRDALILMDRVGLILDVENRTVVTAMERLQMQDNVFTNIDSAVFA